MTRTTFVDLPDEHDADVVIIGAGMAGLYCAMRLIEADPERRITIVERLNRHGGRLQTDLVTIDDNVVREEEGGMRFNYSMTELMSLNAELGLCDKIVPFPMKSDGNTNRFHVRGQSFTAADAAAGSNKIWGELFDLDETERGRSPGELVAQVFNRIRAENNDTITGDRPPEGKDGWTDVREKWTWKGQTLNQWQMWGLLRDMGYSEECIELLSQMNGFTGLFKAPTNAGEGFQVLGDFPTDPRLFTFEDGFSTLPDAIVKRLEDDHGEQVPIALSTNVDRIVREGDRFRLEITEAPRGQNSNQWVDKGTKKTITADQVVVAVATTAMQQLFQTSPAMHEQPDAQKLWNNLCAARGMALMKINLYFHEPWWGEQNGPVSPPVQYGPSFTSLPINSVYPFYTVPGGSARATEGVGGVPEGPAALTIYCDFDNTNFWAGLQNLEPKFTSELQTQHNQDDPQTIYGASQPVVDEIRKQLRVLFSVDDVPEPIMTSYRLWDGSDDFDHAYHQWRVGVVDSEVRAYLAAPLPGLYFCNEAISDMQGWVNGSLRSADDVLKQPPFELEPLRTAPCPPPAAPTAAVDAAAPQPHVSGLWGA